MKYWKRLQELLSKHNLETNMAAKEQIQRESGKKKSSEAKIDTKTVSFDLFKAGKIVAEIAKERNFTIGTIEGHLAYYVGTGDIDINELVLHEKQLL